MFLFTITSQETDESSLTMVTDHHILKLLVCVPSLVL